MSKHGCLGVIRHALKVRLVSVRWSIGALKRLVLVWLALFCALTVTAQVTPTAPPSSRSPATTVSEELKKGVKTTPNSPVNIKGASAESVKGAKAPAAPNKAKAVNANVSAESKKGVKTLPNSPDNAKAVSTESKKGVKTTSNSPDRAKAVSTKSTKGVKTLPNSPDNAKAVSTESAKGVKALPGVYLTIDTVTPDPLRQSGPADVAYTLWNNTTDVYDGWLSSSVVGQALTATDRSVNLLPHTQQRGHFSAAELQVSGKGDIDISFVQENCIPTPSGSCRKAISLKTSQPVSVVLDVSTLADEDHDGIIDLVEDGLLARYRPYMFYTADEPYRPMDVDDYIRKSELYVGDHAVKFGNAALLADPTTVLRADCHTFPKHPTICGSDLETNPEETDYRLNPLKSLPVPVDYRDPGVWVVAGDQIAQHGPSWDVVTNRKNVGLYGHVVPLYLSQETSWNTTPQSTPAWNCNTHWNAVSHPAAPALAAPLYYKVEYWQFFGFNDSGVLGIGKHEGDWITVQVLLKVLAPKVNRSAKFVNAIHGTAPGGQVGGNAFISPDLVVDYARFRLIAVMMYAHGIEWRFDIDDHPLVPDAGDGEFGEYDGPNANLTINLPYDPSQCDQGVMNAQQRRLRMFRDPDTGEFTHPVVYAERGAHELWPTSDSGWFGAASHDGAGSHHFLVSTPPNLGEVDYPRSSFPMGVLVLRFNGKWGTYGSMKGDSPQGPPLHDQWTFPPCLPNSQYPNCKAVHSAEIGHGY
jgi:hypothetical protein